MDDSIHNIPNDGEVEQGSQQRDLSQKVEHYREKVAKQIDESKPLHQKSNKSPAKNHHQNDSAKKSDGAAKLAGLEEELKGLLKANQQSDPNQKQ